MFAEYFVFVSSSSVVNCKTSCKSRNRNEYDKDADSVDTCSIL